MKTNPKIPLPTYFLLPGSTSFLTLLPPTSQVAQGDGELILPPMLLPAHTLLLLQCEIPPTEDSPLLRELLQCESLWTAVIQALLEHGSFPLGTFLQE